VVRLRNQAVALIPVASQARHPFPPLERSSLAFAEPVPLQRVQSIFFAILFSPFLFALTMP